MFHTSSTFVSYNYDIAEADVVFLGVPFTSGSLSKPALYGPLMVREALKLTEDLTKNGNLFEKLKVCDLGDIEVVPGSFELTAIKIKETIADIREQNKNAFIIIIGGDHSISLPIIESLKPAHVVQLDAHADLRSEYLGNPYMQQTWGYHVAKSGIPISQIGVRTWNAEEKENASKLNITQLKLNDQLPTESVHLTLDVDVFDPSLVDTGLPVANGLTAEQVMNIVSKLNIKTMDIVEIADSTLPSKTGFLVAEILKKVLEKKVV